MKRVKWSIQVKLLQRELIGHVGVKLWSVNQVAERMITQNVRTSPNLHSYYIKPMLYYILVYIGRVHLVKYNSGLHLKGRKKRIRTGGFLVGSRVVSLIRVTTVQVILNKIYNIHREVSNYHN
ncbi:hypothetical protein AHAS_Ahas17G0229100 [Arachis hypogaea]